MTRRKTEKFWLPLAAALLALPLGVAAQQAPPAPGAPPTPVGPGPGPGPAPGPTNPPAPTRPTGPPPPLGNGGGQAPLMPPPPPPTPPAPGAPPPAGGGIPGGGGILPTFTPLPAQAGPLPDATHPDVGGAGTRLRYKFVAGQTINYQVVVDAEGNIQMGAGAPPTPLKQHLEMTLGQTVRSVDTSGAATISEKILGFSATLNGQDIPLPPQAEAQIQQPTTVVMTPTGQVLSIKTAAGATAMPPTGFNPSQLSQLQGLPKDPVAVGDKWRSDFASAMTGIETHVAYTLTGLSSDGNTATIAQKVYVAFKPAKAGSGPVLPVKLNGLLTGTGTQQFDITAGQIVSQSNDLTLDLTVTPPTGSEPVKTHFTVTATVQREGAPAGTAVPALPPTNEPPTNQLQ